ncbi:hypothetical protein PF008_g14014 [Phytophthora fragariae]|uniref:Uncharacterized protein n=1 Tax=Phytophthora fragariae TaxID=53985 RepID=A0A6G0RIC0_9STRA|nr:hypothetical protein PF008_g14014 [Phytophthora fragariae]
MIPVLSKITTILAVMPLIRVVAIKAFGAGNMKSPDMAPIVVLVNVDTITTLVMNRMDTAFLMDG